jgi:superfamily II DNA or RNA helicase
MIRDEEWLVRSSHIARPGGKAVLVTGLSELVRGREAIFLTDLDEVRELLPEQTALVTDNSPNYRSTRLYLEALLRRTPPPAGDDRIYLGHKAAVREARYQLLPAAKALRQPRPRLLIADGVGLGKTIEVGILLTELIERHRAERILVVTLKSILAQFQQELWARFTIPLVRLDSVGIQRVQAKIPSSMNPFHHFDRVIVSIDTLKKDAKYRRYLEQCHWDAIVIDECQNVMDKSGAARSGSGLSQRAQLARLLSRTCDALILTSATPHDGKSENFASVIQLLEQTAIADRSNYGKQDIEAYYVRRFKKDVANDSGDAFRERILEPKHIDASDAENAVFAQLERIEFRTVTNQANNRGILFRTLLLKAFLSSPAACISTIDERLKTLDRRNVHESRSDADIAHDRNGLQQLRACAAAVDPESFAKYVCLRADLDALGIGRKNNTTRVVVFSERIDTLRFLQEHLSSDLGLNPNQTALFYGAMDDQEQIRILSAFSAADSPLRILLASDAAAEGLNLHHHCHRLVHFDLPWSLITLEQRNGRIDRYGQTQQPILTYLLTRPADTKLNGDLRILDLLIEKEARAQENLGDVAWLLDLHDKEQEEDHIALGIQGGLAPDQILPDRDAPDDSLAWLFENPDSGALPVEVTSDATLFPDDVSYCREALAAIEERRGKIDIEHHDHLQGFTLYPPEDLRHRLSYLPPELLQQRTGNQPVLKLTADRQRVMRALDDARKKDGDWPEWQLLWEQHPVCEWLDDSLLATFERHEAPVLRIQHGLAPGETVFLLQGQLTNPRGQPVLVEWFGVSCDESGARTIRPFRDLLAQTKLDGRTPNPGIPIPASALGQLQSLLPSTIQLAKKHIAELRLDRMERLSGPLREQITGLTRWHRERTRALAAERNAASASGKALPANKRKVLEREEHEANRVLAERKQWLEDGMMSNPEPYLRVVAVLAKA